jgi:Domain of unknown function (DUF6458)
MGIGIGIFLIALGAILTFAVDWSIGGLDLDAVGWILMVVGVGGLVLFFYFWNQRRIPQAAPAVRQRQVTERPRTYDDPTPPPPTTATMVAPQPPSALVTAVTPQVPAPAQVTTVTATAPVVSSSRGRPEGS